MNKNEELRNVEKAKVKRAASLESTQIAHSDPSHYPGNPLYMLSRLHAFGSLLLGQE